MKTLTKTLEEINSLTLEIEKDYPELFEYLNVNPIQVPHDFRDGQMHGFDEYLASLKAQLKQHIDKHRKKKHKLENLAAQIDYEPSKFQKKIIFDRECQQTMLFAFCSGQGLPVHTTPKDAILIMLEGICTFTLDETEQVLQTGEVFRIPAGVPHSLEANSDFKMVLIK